MTARKITERFIPAPTPRAASYEMRDWLDNEFHNVAAALNSAQITIDELTALGDFGLLDGALPAVSIPDTPDFAPAVNYPSNFASGAFSVDPVAGTITLPNLAGWLEITLFYSMLQTDTAKDFVVVVHLEIDGVPIAASSGSGYIPTQQRDLSLAISTVKTRPVLGGEVLRVLFQVLDDNLVNFDILDSTFRVRYIHLDAAQRIL